MSNVTASRVCLASQRDVHLAGATNSRGNTNHRLQRVKIRADFPQITSIQGLTPRGMLYGFTFLKTSEEVSNI